MARFSHLLMKTRQHSFSAVLACGIALAAIAGPDAASTETGGRTEGSSWQAGEPARVELAEGAPVDVAPWGERVQGPEGREVELWWEDCRDVTRVEVELDKELPADVPAKLQWWQSRWPGTRIPRDRPAGAGESGWLHVGDHYQGRWRDADADVQREGRIWIYRMRPLNRLEYPGDFGPAYRTTYRIRLVFADKAPAVKRLRAYTESVWKSAPIWIEWGGTAEMPQVWDGHLEAFNGYARDLRKARSDFPVEIGEGQSWKSRVHRGTDAIAFRVWYAHNPALHHYDRTVVTVRARQHSFSFDAAQAAEGSEVVVPAYGVAVASSPIPARAAASEVSVGRVEPEPLFFRGPRHAEWDRYRREHPTIYQRVLAEPEQTWQRARADMPPKRQFYIPLGCEGGRQRFGVNPDGSVFCVNDRIDRPAGKDSARRTWEGNRLEYGFGLPETPDERWIQDGCLPIVHARWERGGVRVTQTALATRLDKGGLGYPDMKADDTVVLMVRLVVENRAGEAAAFDQSLSIEADGRPLELAMREGMAAARIRGPERPRCMVQWTPGADAAVEKGRLRWRPALPAQGRAEMVVKIPFITLDQPAEIQRLRELDFADELSRVRDFWRERADAGCQIRVPAPEVADFYRAHVSHLLINCGREVGADRLMARVGGFSYGVYGNESCMMITDLDRRGLHAEAERCLETFLHYQGTSALPGDYLTHEGVFNGAGGWEAGGYNQHHGWILWAMAEHYWMTGDAGWLGRNADRLTAACEWIIGERRRSLALDPRGLRGIERGLLPPGSLEDIQDWRCWLSNNLFSWWGLDAIAQAFRHAGSAAGPRLQSEADAFRADMLAAFREAMVRSPVVRLQDGSWIPMIPSEVHRRGRTYGWITVTLEGPIYLIRTGAIEPHDPLARFILEDYEDNLYLSDEYGYSPAYLQDHWFSRGGFSMQPSLLCSPHPYLMRDEIEHFLRSYFNSLAVGFYPHTRMLTEHPLPDLGDWRGDHYKSSDEANSTYWLRLMFVDERGEDLYLGMAMPREWLRDGRSPAIERAATRFGPMSLQFVSEAAQGRIAAVLDPPVRRAPQRIFLRIRHPEKKSIRRVEVNGRPWPSFDAGGREWIELADLRERARIVAFY